MQAAPLMTQAAKIQDVAWRDDHAFSFACRLEPGLYTVGLQADLRVFDWERVWMPMTLHGNRGQRTGPWDFDAYHENVPLLPTWKIHHNGRYVGLFYLQRPTVEDLAAKTLRGEFGFHVAQPEDVRIEALPFNAFDLEPIALYLEPDAFDTLAAQPWTAKGLAANWARHVAQDTGWETLRRKIAGTEWEEFLRTAARIYREQFQPIPAAGTQSIAMPAEALPLLIFAYRLLADSTALDKALEFVRHWLAQPAWGNPNPYGYGHNGDMGCAFVLKNMTLAYNWLPDELAELRHPLLDRLVRQMDIFFEQQLFHRHYWGGATLQDHGFRSSANAAFTAINLLGHTDSAAQWLAFYLPRVERTLAKLPTDGFIPSSQYHKLQLYADEMTELRVALKFATGRDVFAESGAYRRVPDFLLACLDEPSMYVQLCNPRGDRQPLHSGLPFLFCLAKDLDCPRAKYVAHHIMDYHRQRRFDPRPANPYPDQDWRDFCWMPLASLPLAILEYEPGVFSAKRPPTPALTYFPDGGAIHYRNTERRFHVSVTCFANAASFHALGTDLTGTDQMFLNPSVGNFSAAIGAEPLIQCGEVGYRSGTRLANVLLIDGQGQYGDVGYTMGVPLRVWRGQRIQRCVTDPDGQRGFARLNLAPAYPDALEVLTYTRDFRFEPERLCVRDTVVTRRPHCFAYRFNTWARHRLDPRAPNAYRIAYDRAALDFTVNGQGWNLSEGETDVVWGYVNDNEHEAYRHIEVAHAEPERAFIVEFVLALEGKG